MTQKAEKQTVFTVETPSGIEVLYQSEPKRLYKVRRTVCRECDGGGAGCPGCHELNWSEVPSVTTVLEVLDKPALPWWGMKVGAEGVLAMHNMGLLKSVPHQGQQVLACASTDGTTGLVVAGVEQVIELLTRHKLTVNHVRDRAGVRGTSVHDALEVWANEGTLPDPAMFPPAEQGYVQGLLAFLTDAKVEPIASEVMVGSVQYGFAGRYDIRLRVLEDCAVVFHRTPVRGPQYAALSEGMLLLGDLKTSSGVYLSHSRQLEAYEGASVECGYDPTDARGILHVNPDGTYEFVRSKAEFEDFLCVLEVWRSDKRMKERK